MQKFICKNCDDLICETSICPVCGNRAELLSTEIYYCDKCNVPIFSNTCPCCGSKCNKVGSDVRPVFAEERLLLEVLLDKPFEFADKSIWCTGSNNYLINGKKTKIPFKELRKKDSKEIINKLNLYAKENKKYIESDLSNNIIKSFVKCNMLRLNTITTEAIDYIKNVSSKYDLSSIFVSFSGGKDSTVTSNLVMKALNSETVVHIYGDTTLE